MRNKGTSNYSGNFEVKFVEPIDSRSRVQTKADLVDPSVWASSDGSRYLYDGMIVAVYADQTDENNGIYRLKSASGYTNISNWEKIGSGSGHTIQNSTGTPVSQRTNLRFNNTTITDDSVNDVTIISGIKGDDGADGQSFVPDLRGALTDGVVTTGEATGTIEDYYFILVDPGADDRSNPGTVAPSLVGDMGGHLVAYNGTTWIDYGLLVGVKGDTGDQGPVGPTGIPGLNFVGDYEPATTYSFRDAVRMTGEGADAGNVYYCNIAQILEADNKIPGVNPDWKLLIEKGQQGEVGPQGPAGADGADGAGELIIKPFYIYLPTNKSFGRYLGTGNQYEITAIPDEGWTASEFLRHVAFESSPPTVSVTNNTPTLIYNQSTDVAVNLSVSYSMTTPGATLSSSKIEMSRGGSVWVDKGSLTFSGNTANYTETLSLGGDNTTDIRYRITITDSNSMTATATTTRSFPTFSAPTYSNGYTAQTGYDYGNVYWWQGVSLFSRNSVNTSMVNYKVYVELNNSGSRVQYGLSSYAVSGNPSSFSTLAISFDAAGNIVIGTNSYAVAGILTSTSYKLWISVESDIIGPTNNTTYYQIFSRSFSYKIYYGFSSIASVSSLTDAQINSMINSFTAINGVNLGTATYDFTSDGSNKYAWMAYISSGATPTKFNQVIDGVVGSAVPMMNEGVAETNTFRRTIGSSTYPVDLDYKFIRTLNATSGNLSIKVV